MSNIVAAIGRAQLQVLPDRIEARRRIFDLYAEFLADTPGITFMPEADYGRSTRWLTCITVAPKVAGVSADRIRMELAGNDIEARSVWKPLHLQPLFDSARSRVNGTSEQLFNEGLCLPSGSALESQDVERIAGIIRSCIDSAR
jgi:dTDP-4-amino-4,6-dideoxygalactose transaminase